MKEIQTFIVDIQMANVSSAQALSLSSTATTRGQFIETINAVRMLFNLKLAVLRVSPFPVRSSSEDQGLHNISGCKFNSAFRYQALTTTFPGGNSAIGIQSF